MAIDAAGAWAEVTAESAQIFGVVKECCVCFEDTAPDRAGARTEATVGTTQPFDRMGQCRG